MEQNDRQLLKARLIEMELWGETEPGDPTVEEVAATALLNRIDENLADGIVLAPWGHMRSSARTMRLMRGEFIYPLASGDTRPEAICLTALVLPEFLRQHPECAA